MLANTPWRYERPRKRDDISRQRAAIGSAATAAVAFIDPHRLMLSTRPVQRVRRPAVFAGPNPSAPSPVAGNVASRWPRSIGVTGNVPAVQPPFQPCRPLHPQSSPRGSASPPHRLDRRCHPDCLSRPARRAAWHSERNLPASPHRVRQPAGPRQGIADCCDPS